jgi:IS30 family transposase
MSEIARAFGRDHTSIYNALSQNGGIVPAVRCRGRVALSLAKREDISHAVAAGRSIRGIAEHLRRSPSTVSREVSRHGGRRRYRATDAHFDAWASARRLKLCVLAVNQRLQRVVASKLGLDWSPEQVLGWLKVEYPADEGMRVSQETIYRRLFIQARGVLKKELVGHLHSKRVMRRSRKVQRGGASQGQMIGAVSIRERPAEVEDRAIPGHWEGDLITGSKSSHIATLVERHSRFTALVKVRSKETDAVVSALTRQLRKLPASLRRSLTWNRGPEMAKHKTFTVATNVKVYFCDPQSPWHRGTNGNTNRLLRQYFP